MRPFIAGALRALGAGAPDCAVPMKICIVTPSHLGVSSRAVKEADALSAAGYDVAVIFGQGWSRRLIEQDRVISSKHVARFRAIPWDRQTHPARWAYSGVRNRLCCKCPTPIRPMALTERALGRVFPELARAAITERADLYIGHFPDGLAAAGHAAARTGALLAFDSEDFHLGEGAPREVRNAIAAVQARYLPKCAYVSASSDAIANALRQHYPYLNPATIYNVFAGSAEGDDVLRQRNRTGCLGLYWVSQTIGLDRGLQDAIRAVGQIEPPIQLHVRGKCADGVEDELRYLAASEGVEHSVFFEPQKPPWELLADAAKYDVGLALEAPLTLNRSLCATIKLHLYLAAGLAVAATATAGQLEVLRQAPGVGLTYAPGDYKALAAILRSWQQKPGLLAAAKEASLAAARTRFNWEIESRKLLTLVDKVLSGCAGRVNGDLPREN